MSHAKKTWSAIIYLNYDGFAKFANMTFPLLRSYFRAYPTFISDILTSGRLHDKLIIINYSRVVNTKSERLQLINESKLFFS